MSSEDLNKKKKKKKKIQQNEALLLNTSADEKEESTTSGDEQEQEKKNTDIKIVTESKSKKEKKKEKEDNNSDNSENNDDNNSSDDNNNNNSDSDNNDDNEKKKKNKKKTTKKKKAKKNKEKLSSSQELSSSQGGGDSDLGDQFIHSGRQPQPPRQRTERANKKPKDKLYKEMENPEVRQAIASSYIFDSTQWLKFFEKYIEKYPDGEAETDDEMSPVNMLRLIVQESTFDACEDGFYITEDGNKVTFEKKLKDLKRKVGETVFYNNHFPFDTASWNLEAFETTAHVVEGDAIDVAIWLKRNRNVEPLVLNLADPATPGGDYRTGGAGFEEGLFRRSNLYQFLEDPYCYDETRSWTYPIPEFGGVIAKDITIFRENEKKGYKFMETSETLSFVSMSPLINPALVENKETGKLEIDGAAQRRWKKKISTLFNLALEQEFDSIVISAWGCGRGKNPPEQVANLFQDTLLEEFMKKRGKKRVGAFHYVVFAISDDHNAGRPHNPSGNLVPFQQVWTAEKPETVIKCLIS